MAKLVSKQLGAVQSHTPSRFVAKKSFGAPSGSTSLSTRDWRTDPMF